MDTVMKLLDQHNRWRGECVNLIASENVMSLAAEKAYVSDLMHRYAEGLPGKRYYQGLKFVDEIEVQVTKEFARHFKANYVDVRPISGTTANLAVFAALAQRGDLIMNLGIQGGSHVSHEQAGAVGLLGLKSRALPFDEKAMRLDLVKIRKEILKFKPKFVVMGGSVITFAQPLEELRKICDQVGAKIIYDAAHVLGLVFAGKFQNPLWEGADIITASTHKTFPGPQGGIIIAKVDEETRKAIQWKVFPGVLSNHHLHRLPALHMAFVEMEKFGGAYAEQIVKNARALAQTLHAEGFAVLYGDRGFTESHQVVVDVTELGGGDSVAKKLEEANIILNKNIIPKDSDHPGKPSGLRLGVQEMTRFGMKEKEMRQIARLIARVVKEKEGANAVRKEVVMLRKKFQKVKFC